MLVFNLSQPYDEQFNNTTKVYGSGVYDSITFGVWVFEEGIFYNKGDGGDINWTFVGSFERSNDQGHKVTFYKR